MDATTKATLSRVHETLFDDLGKLGQLIEPCNDRALAIAYQALNHLRDLEALIEPKDDSEAGGRECVGGTPKGLIGVFPEDTLSHVTDTLMVLAHVNWDDCGHNEEFACGMTQIWKVVTEALDYEKGRVGALRRPS